MYLGSDMASKKNVQQSTLKIINKITDGKMFDRSFISRALLFTEILVDVRVAWIRNGEIEMKLIGFRRSKVNTFSLNFKKSNLVSIQYDL